MTTYFTSDTHYGHANVIKYCKRPFLKDPAGPFEDWNVDPVAMDEAMITRWNEVVKPEDTVFHLGDFAMGSNLKPRVTAIKARLNGHVNLVLGNHDRSLGFFIDCGFPAVFREWKGDVDGLKVYMRHHPPVRPQAWHGEYDLILCGHVHERWLHRGKVVNVGVDQWGFRPVTINQLLFVARPGHVR